jgi:hypothetical protein
MPLSIFFWVVFLLAFVSIFWSSFEGAGIWYRRGAGYFALWLLLGILGYAVFGAAVK